MASGRVARKRLKIVLVWYNSKWIVTYRLSCCERKVCHELYEMRRCHA